MGPFEGTKIINNKIVIKMPLRRSLRNSTKGYHHLVADPNYPKWILQMMSTQASI